MINTSSDAYSCINPTDGLQ